MNTTGLQWFKQHGVENDVTASKFLLYLWKENSHKVFFKWHKSRSNERHQFDYLMIWTTWGGECCHTAEKKKFNILNPKPAQTQHKRVTVCVQLNYIRVCWTELTFWYQAFCNEFWFKGLVFDLFRHLKWWRPVIARISNVTRASMIDK